MKNSKVSRFHSSSQNILWNRHFERTCKHLAEMIFRQYNRELLVSPSTQSSLYEKHLFLEISNLPNDVQLFLENGNSLKKEEQTTVVDYAQLTLKTFLQNWQALEDNNLDSQKKLAQTQSNELNQELNENQEYVFSPIILSSQSYEHLEKISIDLSDSLNCQGFIRWKNLDISTKDDFNNFSGILIYVSDFHLLDLKEQELISKNLDQAHWVFGHQKSTPSIKQSRFLTEQDQRDLSARTLDIDNIPKLKQNIKDAVQLLMTKDS